MEIKNGPERIEDYVKWLREEERSKGTIENYARYVERFLIWMNGKTISKEMLTSYKGHLTESGYKPVTVNAMLAAVNNYCRYMGSSCRLKYLRIQRRLFREESRELNRNEYKKLFDAAQNSGNAKLALLMETIAGTGIRVSEVRYITVEAANAGRTQISLKGKIRDIMLPRKLCRKLLKYAQKQKITAGAIFLDKHGETMSRKQIWSAMKSIAKIAGVTASKVFPHNLRHLFAKVFYRASRDIAKLADILGHSSIETTRIYLCSTGVEHERWLEKLELIL